MSTLDITHEPDPGRAASGLLVTGNLRARRPSVVAAALLLALLAVAAVWPSAFASHPNQPDLGAAFRGPSPTHLLGTDQLGRDTFARLVHGTRTSLLIGLGGTALAAAGGALWGLVAALGGRIADEVTMRIADILMAFPSLLLALVVVSVLGPGQENVLLAIGLSLMPIFARIVRIQAKVVASSLYVSSARGLGVSPLRIVVGHVLPNVGPSVLVIATMNVGGAIIAGASLSFLGLGGSASSPDWGSMLAETRGYLQADWWLPVAPGLAITLTVVALSVVGRAMQQRAKGSGR
ncbi:ABC transporter permease [Patulibacter sp. NPDC049589]|uniref:ABC transporter permease n=1 Tax=Patulibacter sp. NPDC049589 TaxID=3154731 RepID=UPI003429BE4E